MPLSQQTWLASYPEPRILVGSPQVLQALRLAQLTHCFATLQRQERSAVAQTGVRPLRTCNSAESGLTLIALFSSAYLRSGTISSTTPSGHIEAT